MKKLVLLLLVLFLLSACSEDSVVYQAPMFNLDNCEDSDGGVNIEEYGVVTYVDDITITKEDFCVDDIFLVERKCQRNKIKTFKVDCSLFETTCVYGACVGIDLDEDVIEEILEEEIVEVDEQEVEVLEEEVVEEGGLCTETDGGRDYYNYGANEGYMAGTWSIFYMDLCRGDPYYDLVEYYCDGDDIIGETVEMPEGYICEDGAFVLEEGDVEGRGTCTETDGGQDYYNYGANEGYMAGSFTTLYHDSCRSDPYYDLVEYYCDGENIIGVTVDVPEGYICEDGAFVLEEEYEYTCTETDDGQDYYNYGENEGYIGGAWSTLYKDICRGDPYNDLVEYYCDEDIDEIKGVAVSIPEGYICEDGAFVLA